jgi:glycosyltransferase involved in cell wall biosynthesis
MSLKLLHLLSSPHMGGAERVCLDLAKAQAASGQDVRVLFISPGAGSRHAEGTKIPFMLAAMPNIETLPRSRRWRIIAKELERAVEQFQPQLVHSHVPLTHLICHRVLPRLSLPWIATLHGSWRQFAYAPQTFGRPYLRPFLFVRHALGDVIATRSAARIVAVAESVKKDLLLIGIAASRVSVIHNGLEPPSSVLPQAEARAQLDLPQAAILVGSMGYHAPVKGFDLLIRAFARLVPRHPHVLLLIAGGDVMGDERPRKGLERLVERLGVGRQVQLLTAQDPRAGFMSALDVFVVPSRSEGMPLVLLEAMFHGKPSVITSAGGCGEAARPAQEALVFQSRNIADLAGKLELLLGNSALRASLGKAAAARASAHLTLARCAAEYRKVYAEVLALHGWQPGNI